VSPETITFRLVPEVRQGSRRAVGFLEGHRELNAAGEFYDLKQSRKEFLFASMDEWTSGGNDITTRFHGFPNDREYPLSFVFKAKEKRLGHRFYGYLYQPKPMTSPRLQICVLCIHALKDESETDRAELERVDEWHKSNAAQAAIRAVYPDKTKDNEKGRLLPWKM
jgi:hypothetical protein